MIRKKIRIIEVLTSLILIASLVLVLVIANQTKKNGYVELSGYSMFRVATGSMKPTIEIDALLICKHEKIEDIRVKDIICFKSNNPSMKGHIITHRVVTIDEINDKIRLTTRGDANVVEDALYVTKDNLIGKVIWYSDSDNIIANVITFMNGKMGFLSLIVMPILMISIFMMRECMRSIKKEMREIKRIEALKIKEQSFDDEKELIERLKREIREELGLDE